MGFVGSFLSLGALVTALIAVLLGAAVQYEHALPEVMVYWSRAIVSAFGIIVSQGLGLNAKALYSEFKALDAVLSRSTQGDPESVLRVIDETGWSGHLLINVGDKKSVFLDDAVRKKKPKLAVELGTFMGYSAVRIARLLPEGSRLISVDPSPQANAIASAVLLKAGLFNRVELAYDYSGNVMRRLAAEGATIDLLFVDHLKWLYLPDTQLAISLGLIKEGSVVVGDNIVFPGAPDFKAFMTNKSNGFDTVVHETFVEYSNTIKDEVTVSTYRR